MPKRFIDATERHLIELLQTTMKQHNPWTGLKGKAVGLLRDITIPKPQDAHNLSVFVTEDFLSKIAGTYEREHVGGAFMTVLSLADEEVREHYLRPNRSQTFARMLIEFRNALKAGRIEGSLSDLSTFTDFVEKIVNQSVGGITYEQGVAIDTMDNTITNDGDPTPMDRALNGSRRDKKRKKEPQTAGMYLGSGGSSGNREDAAKSAVEILIGKDYRLLSPDWLIMRSLAIAYLLKRKEMGLPVEERCPDEEDLEAMFHQERKCAALLYGCVLLSTYVEEIRQEAIRAYEKANPKVSKILKMCKKISEHSGKVLVAYTSFMAASLIATLASGGVGPAAVCGAALGYTAAAGSLALSAPQLGLLAAQGVKSLGKTLGITAAEGAAATAAAGAAVESTTAAATATAAEVARFTSPVALPATIMQTFMMYITFPRIMFSGYEGEWIRKYIESDGGKKEFKPPSMWSPLVASMGIKLIMNTMLGFTPHIEYKPLTTALGWSLYRLYLPLSLIEQPSKVRNAYEVAIAATSRKDVSNFPYSTKTTILCCLVGLAVELALHAAVGTMPTAVSQALNFIVKTARIGAWIGPIIHARRHGNRSTPESLSKSSGPTVSRHLLPHQYCYCSKSQAHPQRLTLQYWLGTYLSQ
ncbi:Cpg1 family polymorphic protein [Anaplasma marginale]